MGDFLAQQQATHLATVAGFTAHFFVSIKWNNVKTNVPDKNTASWKSPTAQSQKKRKGFSINLCLDPPNPCEIDAEPGWIAYHFGIDFTDEGGNCRVTQRSRNVCWDEPSVCDDEFLNGRTIHIIFRLDEEKIKVYHEDTQQAPNYEYSPTLPIHLIRTVELRGDIDQVDAIELKYTTFPN
ncbi:uncharacterized protein LOC134221009 isoform X1 [Armigeres subalbatus]|uniref:uncharacterized protein LOC134221009 isoform X1 n=1 Tax=Armigeres subalbatus TaxID=124917 RepID=UPI002ED30954